MKHSTLTLALAGTCLFSLSGTAALSLVSAWDLNEGSGTTTTQAQLGAGESWNQVTNPSADIGSTASDVFTGIATWAASSGAPGSTASLVLNGTAGENEFGTNVSGTALAANSSQSTFVAWINPTAGNGSILSYSPSHGLGNGQDLRFLIDGSGFLRAEVSGGYLLSNAKDFINDGWNMVAVIFDGNTNTSSFYVGGTGFVTPSASAARVIATGTSGSSGDPLETSDFVIGTDPASRGFTGGLDMIAAYNGAATLAELNDIYANGITVVPEPGTYALMLGLAGLGVVLWRRRRA